MNKVIGIRLIFIVSFFSILLYGEKNFPEKVTLWLMVWEGYAPEALKQRIFDKISFKNNGVAI